MIYDALTREQVIERATRETPGGFLYVVQDADVTHFCKIGRTKCPLNRLYDFGVLLPFRVNVIALIPCLDSRVAERRLHLHFEDKRIRGEWFNLTQSDVQYIRVNWRHWSYAVKPKYGRVVRVDQPLSQALLEVK